MYRRSVHAATGKNKTYAYARPIGLEKVAWQVPKDGDLTLCLPLVCERFADGNIEREVTRLLELYTKDLDTDAVSNPESIQLVSAWEVYSVYRYNCKRQLSISLGLEYAKSFIHMVTVFGAALFTQMEIDKYDDVIATINDQGSGGGDVEMTGDERVDRVLNSQVDVKQSHAEMLVMVLLPLLSGVLMTLAHSVRHRHLSSPLVIFVMMCALVRSSKPVRSGPCLKKPR